MTGGAGFIGSHLCELLISKGWRVRILDNLSTGRTGNIPADAEVVFGDIRDFRICRSACAGARFVFHLAALSGARESMQHPGECYDVNMRGLANILQAAAEGNAERVVFSSSAAVYGFNSSGRIAEDTPPAPISTYGLTKLQGEATCRFFSEHYLLDTVCLRYFNVYGPRQRGNTPHSPVIPRFVHAIERGLRPIIYGDGMQCRDFCDVRDIAQANLLAATAKGKFDGRALNVGTGRASPLIRIIELLADASGRPIQPIFEEPREGDVAYSCADITNARTTLGYEPRVLISEGLNNLLCQPREAVGKNL